MSHDPGGKVYLRLRPGVTGACKFSVDEKYRHFLRRTWDKNKPYALVVMMNPSTAKGDVDDPTVSKVTKMAMMWLGGKFGSLYVGNVHDYRATNQLDLAKAYNPCTIFNESYIMGMAKSSELVVMAYGRPKVKKLQSAGPLLVQKMVECGLEPYALKMSADGTPWHPLYLKDNTEPIPMLEHPAWSHLKVAI